MSRFKDDQKRKTAQLASQYESSIQKMVENQTVQLETWQEDAARTLRDHLTKEYEMLLAFQSRQRKEMRDA